MQILLSRTQAGRGRAVKEQQEEMSPNHVQRINLIIDIFEDDLFSSVHLTLICLCLFQAGESAPGASASGMMPASNDLFSIDDDDIGGAKMSSSTPATSPSKVGQQQFSIQHSYLGAFTG